MPSLPRTSLPLDALPAAKKKLQRRADELAGMSDCPPPDTDWYGLRKRIASSINATIDDVFGVGTADAEDFHVNADWFRNLYAKTYLDHLNSYRTGLARAKACVAAALKRVAETEEDAAGDTAGRVVRAYEGLRLHLEIARASSKLYLDGHYSNAVEDAVKALNALVRLRSGVDDLDGSALMERVFSVKNPLLAFNSLADEQDRNEQKGFMMMFSGAVAGLRNPRAHRIVEDDPERALEFIAFVSLLAKLLDTAEKL